LEMLDERARDRPADERAGHELADLTQSSRPAYLSRTSASGSTPRHSQAVLGTVSGSRRSSFQAEPDRDTGPLHSENTSNSCAGSSLQPLTEQRRISLSPHPPPSLSYADSGFHEPQDEDDALLQPPSENVASEPTMAYQANDVSASTPLAASESELAIATKFPPPLERSDTTIRIGGSGVAAGPSGAYQKISMSSRPTTPVPALLVDDVFQPEPHLTGSGDGDAPSSQAHTEEVVLSTYNPDLIVHVARDEPLPESHTSQIFGQQAGEAITERYPVETAGAHVQSPAETSSASHGMPPPPVDIVATVHGPAIDTETPDTSEPPEIRATPITASDVETPKQEPQMEETASSGAKPSENGLTLQSGNPVTTTAHPTG
jgi:hypothetical protein